MPDDAATESAAIRAAKAPHGVCEQPSEDVLRLKPPFWFWNRQSRQRWKRLASEINVYNLELYERDLPRIRSVLKAAAEALKAGNIDGAWKYFNSARRLELLYESHEQLAAAALAIRSEANKLPDWRKEALLILLGDAQKGELAERVFLAARIRDEHYDNEAYKNSLRRNSSALFAVTIFLAAVTLLWLSWWKHLPPSESNQAIILFSVLIFGLLGATFSATTAATRTSGATRIPELVSSAEVTFRRLFMGPASALVLYFAAQSNLFEKIFTFPLNGSTLLIVAFVAGFSERLVLRVVETISG